MRAVLQRVSRAGVTVEGEVTGRIGPGLLVLVAVEKGDGPGEMEWLARKVAELRIFPDDRHRMNLSVEEAGGGVLAVSQFTLAARLRKGRRPSFSSAEGPERASELFDEFVEILAEKGIPVQTGRFGAMMEVELVNDGPVTIILERSRVGDRGGEA